MKTTVECTCPNCGGSKLEPYDGEDHPNASIDIWKCQDCLLTFAVTIKYEKGKYEIMLEQQWRDDTMYLVPGEGGTCPIHNLQGQAAHLFNGQNSVYMMHLEDQEMYVFSEKPFTVEEAMHEIEHRE